MVVPMREDCASVFQRPTKIPGAGSKSRRRVEKSGKETEEPRMPEMISGTAKSPIITGRKETPC